MKVVINQKYLEGGFFPMKEFKKVIAIVLAVMMLASIAMVSVSAEEAEKSYTVAGSGFLTNSWDPSDTTNDMTLGTDGKYYIIYENVPAGTNYEFKVVEDHAWGVEYGDNGQNFKFNVKEACDVTITFAPDTQAIEVLGDGVYFTSAEDWSVTDIYAVGEAGFTPDDEKGWDASNGIKLTAVADKVWQVEIADHEAGDYSFKFLADAAWSDNWGAGEADGEALYNSDKNLKVEFPESGKVVLTLDLSAFDYAAKTGATYKIEYPADEENTTAPVTEENTTAPVTEENTTAPVTEENTTAPVTEENTTAEPTTAEPTTEEPTTEAPIVVESAMVCGSANLCGEGNTGYGWDPSDTTNAMVKGDDGKFTFTKTLPQGGVYEFKVVVNGEKWIGDANFKFNMKAEGEVTITFDPETMTYEATGEQVDVIKELKVDYIAAVGNSKGDKQFLNGIDWDPAAEANKMTEADGVYTITFSGVSKGEGYQVKFAANGAWAENWGGTFVAFGEAFDAEYNAQGNIEFSTTYDYSDITLTLDLTNVDPVTRGGAVITISEVEGQAPATEEPQKPVVAGFYLVGSEEVLGVEWGQDNVWETCVPMTEVEGSDGKLWTQTFTNVPSSANASDDTGAPRYEFKVVYINDKGGVTWHPGGMGNNTYVTVEKDGSTLVFTFELLASRPTKEGEDPEAVVCEVIPPVEPTTEAPKPATTLTLKAAKTSIAYGATTTVKATVKNGVGKTTFKSSNTKVATVDAKGKVVAKGVGSAKITATNNKVSKTVTIKVVKAANPMKVSSKKAVTASKKKATTIKGVVKVSKAQGTVTYKTSNKKVTVNKKGALVVKKGLKKAVTVKVTVTAKGNKNYKSAKKVVSIKVNVK